VPEPKEPSQPARPASQATVPPSEPRPSQASFAAIDASMTGAAFAARLQMIVALILGLVLVAIPLYLWRRPRTESISATIGLNDAGALPAVTAGPSPAPSDDKLVLGEPKVVSCHDPGPKKTLPAQCDHVAEIERPFAKAIEESAACVPKDAGGGSIIWVADVTFKKKTVVVMAAKEGSTLKNKKVASGCEKAIKAKLAPLAYDAAKHEHARYFVSITATYPGAVK
jgi:hypothetical protein